MKPAYIALIVSFAVVLLVVAFYIGKAQGRAKSGTKR